MRFLKHPRTFSTQGVWLLGAFVMLGALLAILGYASYRNVLTVFVDTNWVRHSLDVQVAAETAYADVATSESYQRAFLLSTVGPPPANINGFAAGYAAARLDLNERLRELRHLVVDNHRQMAALKGMEGAVQEKYAFMDEVMAASRRAGLAAANRIGRGRGPALMDRIHDLRNQMIAEESKLLETRNKRRDRSVAQAEATFTASGLLTLGMLVGLYLMAARFLADQVRGRQLAETHRAELQAQVAERDRVQVELQRSNRELQDFAFIASHDLQEPLRKIQAFGQRLRVKSAERLDPASLDYLVRMEGAANRMQELIDALLSLSRVTTKARPFVPVELGATLGLVIEDLQRRLQESNGDVVVGSLPTVDADPVQMRQLFQNLIANALKFKAADRNPWVEISAAGSPDPNMATITVKDNGIGFEPRHAERIFTIFQRLHGRAEYEGSGIGLAICRRIVDRHGGSISADSAPGEGATFTVVLPRRQGEAAP